MTLKTLVLPLLFVACHPRHPETQRPCTSAAECTRNYSIAQANYNDCQKSHPGSVCAEEANEAEGAFNRMYSAQKQEQELKAQADLRVEQAARAREDQAKKEQEEADRKEREGLARQAEERRRARDEAAQAKIDAQAQAVREATEARQQAILKEAQRKGFDNVRISANVDTEIGHRGHRDRPSIRSVATLGFGAGL